mmetsp:Transcript_8660/g.21563  ORF Transcript_8660/g.21563 Transcript_8660/m.21563 type:complete len:144 (-) Transcript_8660:89-520(-)
MNNAGPPDVTTSSDKAGATSGAPYAGLQSSVQAALDSRALEQADKVALALEVLRARQLELDLCQARKNIDVIVSKSGPTPRSLRAVVPASTVKGLPVGVPVEVHKGRITLTPTSNDPSALFITIDLQEYGPRNQTASSSPHQK